MPLVRVLKKAASLVSYVASSDRLEAPAEAPPSRTDRARNWLDWLMASEGLPEESPPPDLRPPTRGAWFLKSDPFPSDLPVPEKSPGFWAWLFSSERDE